MPIFDPSALDCTAIPLALVARIAGLECSDRSTFAPLNYRTATHWRGALNPAGAAHCTAHEAPAPLLRLSEYCYIGVPVACDYFRNMATQARMHSIPIERALRAPWRLPFEHWNPPIGEFHETDDEAKVFAVHTRRLFDRLPALALTKDWRALQRLVKAHPLEASRQFKVPYVLCETTSIAQCVFWMPVTTNHRARPAPPALSNLPGSLPPGVYEAVALVINNRAQENADLIDIPASVHLTSAGANDEAAFELVGRIHERIQSWLELHFHDIEDEEAAQRRIRNAERRGFTGDPLVVSPNVRSNAAAPATVPTTPPRPRGRPPLSPEEKARRAAERAAALQATPAAPDVFKVRLDALEARIEAFAARVEALAVVFSGLDDPAAAGAVRRLLD